MISRVAACPPALLRQLPTCRPCPPWSHRLPTRPPACRTLLAKEQARIRQQYEERLRDLENERQSVQEDKAQVGSWQQHGQGSSQGMSLM